MFIELLDVHYTCILNLEVQTNTWDLIVKIHIHLYKSIRILSSIFKKNYTNNI
jgi:hypothetical protein